jgi:putative transposase
MPRFARAVGIGLAHHITQRGLDRQQIFFGDKDRHTYLDCLVNYCDQARVRILAYCLMQNHIHVVAVPEEADSFAVALRRAHGRYALYLNASRGRTGHLWQNRFYSCALDEHHLRVALRYVERNPVRANIVERPEQHQWSSAAAPGGQLGARTL